MNNIIQRAALALAVSCAALPAWATATSSANILGVQIILTDLAPGDGVAPSLQMLDRRLLKANSGVYIGPNQFLDVASSSIWGPSRTVTVGQPTVNSSASFTTFVDGRETLSASGSVSSSAAGHTFTQFDSTAFWSGPPFYNGSVAFELGAHTALTMRVYADLQASTTVGTVMQDGSSFSEFATAVSTMELGGVAANGQWVIGQQEFRLRAGTVYAGWDPNLQVYTQILPESRSYTGWMELRFDNTGNAVTSGYVILSAQASGYSLIAATAVPEPATSATLLAGLLGVAALVRRREHRPG